MNASQKHVDVLADLRGVVRIAKAASIGVTGNGPRIERAEQAIAAFADLIRVAHNARGALTFAGVKPSADSDNPLEQLAEKLDTALRRIGGS